jgi:hypothetical protein
MLLITSLARTPRHACHSSDCLHRDCAAAARRSFEAIRHGGDLCSALHSIPPRRFNRFARVRREASPRAHRTAWTSLALPSLFGVYCLLAGLQSRSPGLFLALMLQAVASPMMAAPAFAAVMGLDATLVLTTLVTSTAVTPFTAPFFAYAFIGPALTLSPLILGLKLFTILAGSLLVAVGVRYLVGFATIRRYSDQINGLNILLVFVFVAAVMENVARQFVVAPFTTIEIVVLAFAVFFCVLSLDGSRLRESGSRAELRARAYGFAAEYGIDVGSNRRDLARRDLALLCPCPVPNLSLTVFPGTAGQAIDDRQRKAENTYILT